MAEQSSAQIREQIYLQRLTGPLAGQKINLSNQRLTIGRDPAFCNVVADWEGVSRQHATIEIAQHDSIIIADAGSKAGTFVNGEAVSRRILRAGDVIALGSPAVSLMLHAGSQSLPQTGVFKPPVRDTRLSVVNLKIPSYALSRFAVLVLPLILIPQLLLSGFLKPIDDLYVNRSTNKPAIVEEFRGGKPGQVIKSYDGLGAARYAAAAIVARWSLDALAHAVSVNDKKAREQLALNMTIAAYEHVAQGKSETDIARAFEDRVKTDLAIIAGFIILFLALTGWALKRKDVF